MRFLSSAKTKMSTPSADNDPAFRKPGRQLHVEDARDDQRQQCDQREAHDDAPEAAPRVLPDRERADIDALPVQERVDQEQQPRPYEELSST